MTPEPMECSVFGRLLREASLPYSSSWAGRPMASTSTTAGATLATTFSSPSLMANSGSDCAHATNERSTVTSTHRIKAAKSKAADVLHVHPMGPSLRFEKQPRDYRIESGGPPTVKTDSKTKIINYYYVSPPISPLFRKHTGHQPDLRRPARWHLVVGRRNWGRPSASPGICPR